MKCCLQYKYHSHPYKKFSVRLQHLYSNIIIQRVDNPHSPLPSSGIMHAQLYAHVALITRPDIGAANESAAVS